MAEPLKLEFQADTSRASAAMNSLAASVFGNMAMISVAMSGGAANTNSFGGSLGLLVQNATKAATAVGMDIRKIAGVTAQAATAQGATLQGVTSAAAAAAASSTTAQATIKAGVAGTTTAVGTLIAQVPALGLLAVGLGSVVVGYGLVSAAVGQANEQLDKFVALGTDAEKAGVGVGFVQRFREVAEQAKLSASEVTAALRSAGEAVTPKFGQADAIRSQLNDLFETGYLGNFQSKGLSDYLGASDNDGRIRAAVTAMQELNSLGERLAAIDLAGKLFGNEVAERVRAGRLDFDAIAQALDRKRDDLITSEQTRQAEEFRDRLNDAYKELDKSLGVSLSLTAAGRDLENAWLAVVEAVAGAAKAADGLLSKLDQARTESSDLLGQLGTLLGAQAVNRYLFPNQGKTITTADDPAGPPAPLQPPLPPRRPLSFYTDNREPHERSGGGESKTDPIESFVNQLQKSAAAVKAEADAIHKSNAEKAVAIELARAQEVASQNGRKLSDAETAAITAAATQRAKYRDVIADVEQAQRQAAETARYFGQSLSDGLADAVLEGKSLTNVLLDLEKQFARSALNALFTGQGPLAGLLGTAPAASSGSNAVGGVAGLLSGGVGSLFRANGGDVAAGRAYTVGEMGRELFVPGASGRMYPVGSGGVSGAASPPAINIYNYAGDQVQATPHRRADGGLDLVVRGLENAMAGRAAGGRGPFRNTFGSAGNRIG